MLLESILSEIQQKLVKREEVREELNKDMRKSLRLSKQAILFVHQQRFKEATSLLEDADRLFDKLRNLSTAHPDLMYIGLVRDAFEEYCEAHTFLKLVVEKQFVHPENLRVPLIPYILGLGDVIGELRRRALDSIRQLKLETAEWCLESMEQIYSELTTMDEAYLLVPGLRRKCDIARRVIETTRGDVTLEARRSSLDQSIRKLEATLQNARSHQDT